MSFGLPRALSLAEKAALRPSFFLVLNAGWVHTNRSRSNFASHSSCPKRITRGLKNSSTSTKLPPQPFTVPRFSSASSPPHNHTQSRSSGIHHHGRAHPQQASRLEHGAVSLPRSSPPLFGPAFGRPVHGSSRCSWCPSLPFPPHPDFPDADAISPERRKTPLPTTRPSPRTRSSPMCRASRRVCRRPGITDIRNPPLRKWHC